MLKITHNHRNGPGGDGRVATRRGLVLVSPNGIPQCLLFALEREFESMEIMQVPDIDAVCDPVETPVALILIDLAAFETAGQSIRECARIHPASLLAVMVDDEREAAGIYRSAPDIDLIRGILPMNLKLDVWLSVIALMMRGGEYFPAATFRVRDDRLSLDPEHGRLHGRRCGSRFDHDEDDDVGGHGLSALTEREFQVLQHVSRGTQNKLIAVELGLSEHTVKIHIHNVIRKLGTRNRTEAAALFLQSAAHAGSARGMRMSPIPR